MSTGRLARIALEQPVDQCEDGGNDAEPKCDTDEHDAKEPSAARPRPSEVGGSRIETPSWI